MQMRHGWVRTLQSRYAAARRAAAATLEAVLERITYANENVRDALCALAVMRHAEVMGGHTIVVTTPVCGGDQVQPDQLVTSFVSPCPVRGAHATAGSADPLLVAILEQWDDEQAGGPALLRACGLTADQASQLAATLLPQDGPAAAGSDAEPRVIGRLRFVVDQAYRIAAEAHAPYVGTEHLVVAILWDDFWIGAHELRRHGVSYAQALEQLAALPHTEQGEQIDLLEEVQVPTPAVARLDELACQQAEQHPIEGDGRISTLHHLLALLVPPTAASRLLRELGVDYEAVVRHIEEEGARRVAAEDWRAEEHRLEGWEEFRVTDQQNEVIRGRFHAVNKELRGRGVRFMFGKRDDNPDWSVVRIHPGGSGLDPRGVLDRLLGHAS
jgi:hypothetical protein